MKFIIASVVSFIIGLLTNYLWSHIKLWGAPKKSELAVTAINDTSNWRTSNGELFSYDRDPSFTIKIYPSQDNLSERFKKFPDRNHDVIAPVELKYGDAVLFAWNFMYLDGARLLIPVPKSELDINNNTYDFYDLNGKEIKIFEIIGQCNLQGESTKIAGLRNVANHLGIQVTDL